MAVNQQLKDYILQQIKLGVSKDTVKGALVSAGWKEEDVSQAMAESETGRQTVTGESVTTVAPVSSGPVFSPGAAQSPASQPAAAVASAAVSSAAASSPGTGQYPASQGSASPVSFVTSDIFKPKGEQVFQPASADKKTAQEAKPQTAFVSADQKEKPSILGGNVLTISLGVLSVFLLGGNVYLFFQNRNLGPRAGAAPEAVSPSPFEAQVASLTAEKDNLAIQIDSLDKTVTDLSNQLSIFVAPATSSTAAVPFSVSGVLGGGGKVPYSLTTSKNIALTVKNYKEADVEAALKTLLGTQVELGGTHQPGSIQLTVATINGKPLKDAADAARAAASALSASSTPATVSTSTQMPALASSSAATIAP